MNFQQVDYIIAVGELSSFGEAAKKCFVTQSTLSTMVARFEEEVGVTIFDRKTKPVTVTEEGAVIINQLKTISREVDHLNEVVLRLKGEISGTLNIGVIPTIAPYILPLFLKEFITELPKVHFVVSELTTAKIIENVVSRAMDIGIISIPVKHPDLIEIPLYVEPFLLYDKANSGLTDGFKVSEIDYKRLWLLEEGHCMRTQAVAICDLRKKRKIIGNLDYKSGTIDTLMKFVNKNNGITLLPYMATLDFTKKEQKHLKQFKTPVPARAVGMVVHKHFVKEALLERLKLAIQEKVQPLLEGQNRKKNRLLSPL